MGLEIKFILQAIIKLGYTGAYTASQPFSHASKYHMNYSKESVQCAFVRACNWSKIGKGIEIQKQHLPPLLFVCLYLLHVPSIYDSVYLVHVSSIVFVCSR